MAVLTGNEVLNQVLCGQSNLSEQLNEIAFPIIEGLAKLTSNINSIQVTVTSNREQGQSTPGFHQALREIAETIREEIAALRSDLSPLPLLADQPQIDRTELQLTTVRWEAT